MFSYREAPFGSRFFMQGPVSVVLLPQLEIALRMAAGGADLRRLGADDDVSAVAAFPDLDLALFKDLRRLQIVQQGAVADRKSVV